MNILHIIETLGVGGAERLLVTQLGALHARGENVVVAVLKPPYTLEDDFLLVGVKVVKQPVHNKWNIFSGVYNLARLSKKMNSDVVHAHLYFPSLYTSIAKIFGFLKSATVVTFHNLAYQRGANKKGAGSVLKKLLSKITYKYGFDTYIAVSKKVADHYASELDLRNIVTIHNPVNIELLDNVKEQQSRAPSNNVQRLVLPGRLVHEKGHSVFIESLVILRDQSIVTEVYFAGGGPLRNELQDLLADTALNDTVIITGELEHSELLKIVKSANIVIVPSLFEGFGLTALEAGGLGRPVVCTNVGGLTEIVLDKETGIVVQPNSAHELAEAIKTLLGDKELRLSLGVCARERARSVFSLDLITDSLVVEYEQLLN